MANESEAPAGAAQVKIVSVPAPPELIRAGEELMARMAAESANKKPCNTESGGQ